MLFFIDAEILHWINFEFIRIINQCSLLSPMQPHCICSYRCTDAKGWIFTSQASGLSLKFSLSHPGGTQCWVTTPWHLEEPVNEVWASGEDAPLTSPLRGFLGMSDWKGAPGKPQDTLGEIIHPIIPGNASIYLLEEVARDREVWASLLRLKVDKQQLMDR